jgi:hypothetical protein
MRSGGFAFATIDLQDSMQGCNKNKRGKPSWLMQLYGRFVGPRLSYQVEELYSFVQRQKGKCFHNNFHHPPEDYQENQTVGPLGFPDKCIFFYSKASLEMEKCL